MEFKILSLLPALITIIIAIISKEALISLFIGIFSGCLIMGKGNPFESFIKLFDILIKELSETANIQIILIVIMLGGLLGILTKSGSCAALTRLLMFRIKSRKGTLIAAWLMGIMIFFDDYFNALITGSIIRPVSDKYKISRERLSYSIDSTAVGICLISPVSSWSSFIVSLIAISFAGAGIRQDPFRAFLQAIPYNYYAFMTVMMAGISAFISLNFGPMAKAEKRAKELGVLCSGTFSGISDNSISLFSRARGKAVDIIIPVLILICGAFGFMLYTGGFFNETANYRFFAAMKQMNGTLALNYAIFFTILCSVIYFKVRKLSSIRESVSAFITGMKPMSYVIVLLVFAWVIGAVCDELDTYAYMASILSHAMPRFLIPAVLFLFSAAIALTTGASWGAYAIMIPVAVSMAAALDLTIPVCIAAVIGGGGFGTHCSPLADNVIISSAGADIRHIDHVKSQAPYSAVCAIMAVISYILAGIVSNPFIPAAACILLFGSFVFVMKRCFHK